MANPIIDRARMHFRGDEPRRIEVPEWGEAGAPLVLLATPVTLAEKKQLNNRYKDGGLWEMYVHALILKARTPDGKPAFDLADKRDLMTGAAPEVVERIAQQILHIVEAEDAAKN
jgi:hypothetical protein